jgi:hypothetical protein
MYALGLCHSRAEELSACIFRITTKTANSSEMFVTTYKTTLCHNPNGYNLMFTIYHPKQRLYES